MQRAGNLLVGCVAVRLYSTTTPQAACKESPSGPLPPQECGAAKSPDHVWASVVADIAPGASVVCC